MMFDIAIRMTMSILTIAMLLSVFAVVLSWITRKRQPALEHACWVIVLLRLVVPPVLPVMIPGYPQWSLSTTTVSSSNVAISSSLETARRDSSDHRSSANSAAFDEGQQFPQNVPTASSSAPHSEEVGSGDPTYDVRRSGETSTPDVTAAIPTTKAIEASSPTELPRSATMEFPRSATTDNVSATQVPSQSEGIGFIQTIAWTLLIVWLAGTAFVLAKSIRAAVSFGKLLRLSEPVSADIMAVASQVASRLGLRNLPSLRMLAVRIPPFVWSTWRPQVVLPRDLEKFAQSGAIELLLTHELVHVKRLDYLVRYLEWLATVIWWWCPLLYYARRKMRMAEESACDAWVLRVWPERASEYATAILDTIRFVGSNRTLPHLTTGGLGSVREIESRLRAIHENRARARNGAISVLAVAILAVLSCTILLIGESSENESETKANVGSPDDQKSSPPSELVEMLDQEKAASSRAVTFNSDAVLKANRLWQNPTLGGIESIEFTHRMAPTRLDEHFVWRKDGAHLVEVTDREDNSEQYGVGWSRLSLPDASTFTFASPDAFPRYRTAEETLSEGEKRRDKSPTPQALFQSNLLRHLSGTRLNFAGIDWGRRPADFTVTDHSLENELHTIELRPSKDAARNFIFNAGAMFATTSWSYVHDVAINRSVLTIDQQNRILRERSYFDDALIAEIELLDWTTTADGQHAPLRITMAFPKSEFTVDQRFRVTAEGLWILESGRSKFAAHDAQTEEIIDLKINVPSETLEERIHKAKSRLEELSLEAKDTTKIQMRGLTPLDLGAKHIFDRAASPAGGLHPTSLSFMPIDTSQRFREMWPHPELVAELQLPKNRDGNPSVNESLLLVLYDEFRSPLFRLYLPEAVIDANAPTADTVLSSLWEKQRLWLRAKDDSLPSATYSFHLQDRQIDVTLPSEQEERRRGITFKCALDTIRTAPERWRVPMAFDAEWNGRAVRVLGITGPAVGQVFGSGLDGVYVGGYSVTQQPSVLLVIDAATGSPLVERSEHMEFQFHDYVEASPGQFAPLRILCKSGSILMDLRFQIVDGKLWLFDRKAGADIPVPAYVDNLRINEAAPSSVQRSQLPDAADLPAEFDWSHIVNRRPIRSNDNLSSALAAWENPLAHPLWEATSRTSIEDTADAHIARCSLRSFPPIGVARYWTLTQLTKEGGQALSCAETLPPGEATTVNTTRVIRDKTVAIPHPTNIDRQQDGSANPTRVLRLTSTHRDGFLTAIQPEILSTNWYTQQSVRMTAIMLNADGVALHGGMASDSFRTYAEPVVRAEAKMEFEPFENTRGLSLLIGCHAEITGAPLGSTWGSFSLEDPLFEPSLLMGSRFPAVRHIGVRQIYREQYRDLTRQFTSRDRGERALEALAPHKAVLKFILSNSNGDEEEAIAIACRLAGFSQDPEFTPSLRTLLSHSSEQVKDSAAIGLGLLGNADGLERLQALAARSVQESSPTDHPFANRSSEEAQWALERLEK